MLNSEQLAALQGPIARLHPSVLVAGPPCSGKTTYVREHAEPRESVLDYDEVYAELSGDPLHVRDERYREQVDAEFRRLLRIGADWIIRCAPQRGHRATLRKLCRARSVVLAVPAEVCLERLEASDRPPEVKERQARAIHEWWGSYEPSSSPAETVIGQKVEPPGQSRAW